MKLEKYCRPRTSRRREIIERRFRKTLSKIKESNLLIRHFVHATHGCEGALRPRISKSLLNARLCRLTETARLLKNVKSVFTRRSNAASRVSVEVELSRKLSLPQTLSTQPEKYPPFMMPERSVPPPVIGLSNRLPTPVTL